MKLGIPILAFDTHDAIRISAGVSPKIVGQVREQLAQEMIRDRQILFDRDKDYLLRRVESILAIIGKGACAHNRREYKRRSIAEPANETGPYRHLRKRVQ